MVQKSCTTKDDDYPIIYRVLTIPGGDRRISAINRIMENKNHSATSKDLEKFAASARTELGKVRRIQAGFIRKVGINGLGGWFLKKGGSGFK